MNIAIIALGSRGDVQPYVALGKGLHEAGHAVRLITHVNYETFVRSYGLGFWPMQGDVQELMQTPEMRELTERGNFLAITRRTAELAQGVVLEWTKEGLAACAGMELLIAGVGGLNVAIALAEKTSLPLLQAFVFPFTPTRAFPAVLLPPGLPRLGGAFNRFTHHLTRQFMWQGFRGADTLARQKVLGLPAAAFFGPYRSPVLHNSPILYGISPSVIAKPADWGSNVHVTGYWFLDAAADWTPPMALQQFLEAGAPPVTIGFGSMSNRNPEATLDLVLHALDQTGQRGIILSGWGGMQKANWPDNVFVAEAIPHTWLFERVAAVVHHGGAGTTAAGLRAGVPSIIIPFFGDQPFWGEKVAALGVGPTAIPRQKLTAARLAQAIHQAVTDEKMRENAAALGSQIRSEDGVARAVSTIQAISRKQQTNR